MKACQPPRHPLFIHAPEFGGPRDEIFPRTEDSHNETEPSLIGPFRPIKNEVPGGEEGEGGGRGDRRARNGTEVILPVRARQGCLGRH